MFMNLEVKKAHNIDAFEGKKCYVQDFDAGQSIHPNIPCDILSSASSDEQFYSSFIYNIFRQFCALNVC